MCGLFGFVDAGHKLTRKQRSSILSALATASESRGTDATGIAYNAGGKLNIYKRPIPAHCMWFRVPAEVTAVTGHTRAVTQGVAIRWHNNHPFLGKAGGCSFALAHNGVLFNDSQLRKKLNLPKTKIETDSYVAVQLIETQKELSFASLQKMVEQLEGSACITVLSDKDDIYLLKGDNPLCLIYFRSLNLYLYTSTFEIMQKALKSISFRLGEYERIELSSGEILRIEPDGHISRRYFDDRKLYSAIYSNWFHDSNWGLLPEEVSPEAEYISVLKSMATYYGFHAEDVDTLLAEGFSITDVEEILCGC